MCRGTTIGVDVRGRRGIAVAASGVLVGSSLTVLTGVGAGAAPAAGPRAAAISAATAVSMAKPNPETKKRKPDQDLGYYLGDPRPTYQWHGCTHTSTRRAPTPTGSEQDVYAQYPQYAPTKGSKQGKVAWGVIPAATSQGWAVTWEVKNPAKWKICGVEVAGGFARPGVSERYVASAGYTSGAKKGKTATAAEGETWKLDVPKNSKFGWAIPAEYENKMLDTKIIYGLTVFIAKKK